MKDATANKPTPTPDPANLNESEMSSNEQTEVPWFNGQRTFALKWVSPIYNPTSKDSTVAHKK